MTVSIRALLEAAYLAVAQTTQYTAPVNTRVIIDKMTATNTSGAAATFVVYLVASGAAASAANRIISTQTVGPGVSYLCPEIVGHILGPGDFIVTEASLANSINMRISGREVN